MKSIYRLLAFIAFSTSVGSAFASTYYVATTNNYLNGNAATDISTALTSAFADSSGTATVIVPAGQYRVDSTINLPGTVIANVTIQGEGIGVTQIVSNTSGNLFDFTFSSASYHVSFQSLSLMSNATSGTAVKITYSSGTPATGLNLKYVNITAYNGNTSYLFAKGIELSNAPNSTLSNTIVCEGMGRQSGTGIDVDTESDYLTVQDSQVNSWQYGLKFDSANESAVNLNRCYWVESIWSVYSSNTVSTLGMNAGHIDLNYGYGGTAGVYIANASDCDFENILFFSESPGTSLELPTANGCTIADNTFFDNTGANSSIVYLPISIGTGSSSYGDMIADNSFQFNDVTTSSNSQIPYYLGSGITTNYMWSNLVMGPNTAEPSTPGSSDGYNTVYNQATSTLTQY